MKTMFNLRAYFVKLTLAGVIFGESVAAANAAPVTLNFWDMQWGLSEYAVAAQKVVDRYNREHPDVHVIYRSVPWTNWFSTFTASVASPQTGIQSLSIAVGDFNGDGNADLAIANEFSNTVTVLLGNGDGTFAPGPSPLTGGSPSAVAIGDFNGDGIPDVAVAHSLSNNVAILTSQLAQTTTATATGISPVGTGLETLSYSLQYAQARLQRRIGIIWARMG